MDLFELLGIDNKIGLVIKSYKSIAKCISIVRKYKSVSMAEVKTAIDSGKYVFDCDYTDDVELRKVRRCYDELVKSGAVVEIYEHQSLTTRQFISNLLGTYKAVERETQREIDAEVAAEEESG